MKMFLRSLLPRAIGLLAGVLVISSSAAAATQYVVANDDSAPPFGSGVTFYTVAPNGLLTLKQQVLTDGFGIAGGFFGANRIRALNSGGQSCVYASQATDGNIVGINVNTLTVGGSAAGSINDAGTSNGIGLAMNEHYLYASFTDSNTIGTFQVQSGCGLTFLSDTAVAGLKDGIINGMALRGNMLIATYTDGSIESFDTSGGTPVSHGDKQLSTATVTSQDATFPNSVDITRDGHYAIFGDTSTAVVVEVSDLSSGKLSSTVVYKSQASISSSNIMLSPDETLLYVVNTQGDRISATFFDKATGKISGGCTSGPVRGLSENWSYLAGLALASQSGNGGGVYVAEFGSGIAMIKLNVSGRRCSLHEVPQSPAEDPNSPGLLSIGTFPPRPF
jgi:sugar lactone lactonase YvrE